MNMSHEDDNIPSSSSGVSVPIDSRLVHCVGQETDKSFVAGGKRYVFTDLLGEGGFGQVFRCSCQSVNGETNGAGTQQCAVKIINANRIATLCGSPLELVVPRLLREVEVLRLLGGHTNIVALYGAYFSNESLKLYLVYELLQDGDLFNAIVARRKGFGETDACKIFVQLTEAVAFGHRQGVAHRDIKLENCLMESTRDLKVKLCDYGQAKLIHGDCTSKTLTTTIMYTAPDVHSAVKSNLPYDAFKADAFSLGILLFALISGSLQRASQGITGFKNHRYWKNLSDGARNLIKGLLRENPLDRLSVQDILQHPWVVSGGKKTPAKSNFDPQPRVKTPESMESFPTHVKPEAETQLMGLILTNQIVRAVQRERGLCMGAMSSKDIEPQFQWHVKYTNQRIVEAFSKLEEIVEANPEISVWSQLCDTVKSLVDELPRTREKGCYCPAATDSDFEHAFALYTELVMCLISQITIIVRSLRPCQEGAVQLAAELRYKMLMLMSEQLARERGFISGRIDRPERLRDSAVQRHVHEIIGARKLLFGSPTKSNLIVSSQAGILPAIGLGGASPLEPDELCQLEDAENRALASSSNESLSIAEWFRLLTKLIDKLHQGVTMNLVELFTLNSREPSFASTLSTSVTPSIKLNASPE